MGLDMFLKNSKGEQVAYWRKSNQIRGWLVTNGIIGDDDDCVERPVSNLQLVGLVRDCKLVLSDHKLAEELLPVTSGFFFGSDKYDEWYYKDLEETVKMLEPLLDKDETYIYHDWW